MKVEFEVKAFGSVEAEGAEEAYKSTELVRVKNVTKETTLAELESILAKIVEESERDFKQPEQLLGKITIRIKKEGNEIKYI